MNESTARWPVRTSRPVSYEVIKSPGLFEPDSKMLASFGRTPGRRFIVVDAEVARFHLPAIRAFFDRHRIKTCVAVIAGGEANKTIETYQELVRQLDDFPIHRRDEPIIAIGGGVLTDIVAFVAATYRRGIPHLKIPTTLMGYVDASIGIKAGINFNGNKNRLGAFEPPQAVLLDRSFLTTLPRRHLLNGLCEIIKLGVICDAPLFELIEQHGRRAIATCFAGPAGDAILDRAIGCMLAELSPNLFESDLARAVDFGHTFSYGLEARHEQDLLHGEAVLLDILVSVILSYRRGLLGIDQADRILSLVRALEMRPALHLLDEEAMWASLQDRVDHRNGLQRVPLPAGIGRCTFASDITREELGAALAQLHAISEGTRASACG